MPQPEIITRLFDAVYPSFAMLASMEVDLFTPLGHTLLHISSRTWTLLANYARQNLARNL
jgi:hypothetical protein